ncbi:RNA-directed DNA polymerase, eukaryota [Tanacetum coccineum]
MAPEFWCQTTPTEFWCHGISGAKLHFADVAPLLEEQEWNFHRGLRQGDPLSPFLFILMMENLHVAFQRVIERGMFNPIIIGKDAHASNPCLFYVDDAMFIGKWSTSNVNVLIMMLHCFFLASGLKINVNKSGHYGVGVHSSDVQMMVDSFGCLANSLPFTYLGVKVPDGVLNQIEGLRNSFFLGEDSEERLWLDVIKAIYGSNGCLNQPASSHKGCSVWLTVHKAITQLKTKGVDLMEYCKKVIENVVLSSANDRWSWSLNGNGVFSVKSAREVIDKHLLIISPSPTRWSKLIPIKLNIFAWRMFLDKLPTKVNLSNKGIDIPCVLCLVCGSDVESRNHIFSGCSLALDLFKLMGRWWNIHIPSLPYPLAWEVWFDGWCLNSLQRSMLEATFFSLWWHIWNFRNAVLFSSENPKKILIFDNVVSQSWLWVNYRSRKANVFWLAWLIDPSNAISPM